MSFETSLIFAISLILLWIKPGPAQAFKITRALNNGFWPAFYAASGIIAGCIVFFLVAVLGLQIITDFFYDIRFILKFIGGLYFLYIGIQGFRNIKSGQWIEPTSTSHKKNFAENFGAGLILTFGNPLDIVYFMGIMPTLVPVGSFTPTDILLGISILVGIGLSVDVLILLLVGQTKEALANTNFVKKVNIITSAGFILIALFLFYSALFLSNFSFNMT